MFKKSHTAAQDFLMAANQKHVSAKKPVKEKIKKVAPVQMTDTGRNSLGAMGKVK